MGRPRVKVVNPNEGWMGTEYYIDGNTFFCGTIWRMSGM